MPQGFLLFQKIVRGIKAEFLNKQQILGLLKGDLRITAGAKHILEGIHKDAYDAFNSSRNIMAVLDKVIENRKNGRPDDPLSVGATLMHPVRNAFSNP